MENVIFENDIVVLRKPNIDDAEALMRLTNDKEVMLYYGMKPFKTLKEAQDEIYWFIRLFKKKCGRWVIAEKNTNTYIGDIGFFNFQEHHKRVEIGFRLAKKFWKKNIMSECLAILLKIGFNRLNYNRIEALVDKRNTACKKLLTKMNFKREGLLREYEYEYEFGHFIDLEMYSILRKEYINT